MRGLPGFLTSAPLGQGWWETMTTGVSEKSQGCYPGSNPRPRELWSVV
jgi:hypothetical protein